MAKLIRPERLSSGNMTELPLIMFTMFLMFVFPLINLGTTALRYSLFVFCCKQGAASAAQAYSFSVGTTARPAAIVSGPAKVASALSAFPGINLQSTTVKILAVRISDGVVTEYTSKLSKPADTSNNLYFIELTSIASIEPMTRVNVFTWPGVPGLNSDWTSKVSVRQFVESPQGLDE